MEEEVNISKEDVTQKPDITEEDNNDENDDTIEDVAIDNEARIDALVELLIKKGIITEEEFEKAYDEQFEGDSE